jgi:hypothetical protein
MRKHLINFDKLANQPAAGTAGLGPLLPIGHHLSGVPEPYRSASYAP